MKITKTLFLLPIAFAFLFPAAALAQDTPKSDESKISSKITTISGKVSDDGATIIDEKDVHWTVSNPVMLSPFAGQSATVKGHLYKGETKIQVITASGILQDSKQVAKKDNSAFRR
ncbi:MAG: hypothetical protein WB987_07615 [Candidatus Acidiferrales bacterium]